MTKAANGPSGTNSSPGGASEETSLENQTVTDSPASGETKEQKNVSYETYQRTLDQKNKADEELRSLREKEKKREEDDLRAKENYKTLLESREKELTELRTKVEANEARINEGLKLKAVLSALPGNVDRKYFGLVDLSKVALDPDTGLPDPISVKNAANALQTEFPEVIQSKDLKLPPSNAARGSSAKLSYKDWLALPDDTKADRMKDVDKSTM